MISEKDLWRLEMLYSLDRVGRLPEFMSEVLAEFRAQGVGRTRDAWEVPPVGLACRTYEMLYQPPSRLNTDEVVHALFASKRMRIVDQVLRRLAIRPGLQAVRMTHSMPAMRKVEESACQLK